MIENAGCDMLAKCPEVRNWLLTVQPREKNFIVGAYAYLDGPMFVRVAMAMDAMAMTVGTAHGHCILPWLMDLPKYHLPCAKVMSHGTTHGHGHGPWPKFTAPGHCNG